MNDNDLSKYSLQLLRKELLQLKNKNDEKEKSKKISIKKIYGLFGDDNTFIFSKQKSGLQFHPWNTLLGLFVLGEPIISKYYYLVDYFIKDYISDVYDKRFSDNDNFEYNGINYVPVILTKIIPASYLENLTLSNLYKIQDEINVCLSNNPDFIESLFQAEKNKDGDFEEESVNTNTRKTII